MQTNTLEKFKDLLNFEALSESTAFHGDLYHYTSLKSINPILLSEKDAIVLWASRFDCLNDMSEGIVAEKRYTEVCLKLKEEGLITDEQYQLFASIRPSKNETFILSNDGDLFSRYDCDTYIISFSTQPDVLSMWSYYSKGNMYEAFSLGLKADALTESLKKNYSDKNVAIKVCSVIYKKSEQEKLIRELLLKIANRYENEYDSEIREIIASQLMSWKLVFKEECFSHEHEVRIIMSISKDHQSDYGVKYRIHGGYIIPYIEVMIDKKAFSVITLGPLQGNDEQKALQKSILHEMLVGHGYEPNERCSEIPVRY